MGRTRFDTETTLEQATIDWEQAIAGVENGNSKSFERKAKSQMKLSAHLIQVRISVLKNAMEMLQKLAERTPSERAFVEELIADTPAVLKALREELAICYSKGERSKGGETESRNGEGEKKGREERREQSRIARMERAIAQMQSNGTIDAIESVLERHRGETLLRRQIIKEAGLVWVSQQAREHELYYLLMWLKEKERKNRAGRAR